MRIGIKEFQKRFPRILNILDQEKTIEITRRGTVIAELNTITPHSTPIRSPIKAPIKKPIKMEDVQVSPKFEMCNTHSVYKHTCGCK